MCKFSRKDEKLFLSLAILLSYKKSCRAQKSHYLEAILETSDKQNRGTIPAKLITRQAFEKESLYFLYNSRKTEMMTKLVVILALTTLVQVALADTSTKTQFTFSKFVKDLTEKSRRKRSPSESESDEPPLFHPEIRYNVLREISRGPRANMENNLPPKPHVPCGDCQVRSMWVTIKRPSCKSVKIRVPACQGLCTSWEVSFLCYFI